MHNPNICVHTYNYIFNTTHPKHNLMPIYIHIYAHIIHPKRNLICVHTNIYIYLFLGAPIEVKVSIHFHGIGLTLLGLNPKSSYCMLI